MTAESSEPITRQREEPEVMSEEWWNEYASVTLGEEVDLFNDDC